MLVTIVALIVIVFIIMLPFAFIKVAMSKSSECHKCGKKFKMLGDKVKCPFCKTKYYKQPDGTYITKD